MKFTYYMYCIYSLLERSGHVQEYSTKSLFLSDKFPCSDELRIHTSATIKAMGVVRV